MSEERELTEQEQEILSAGVTAKKSTFKEALEARKANLEAELAKLGEEIKNYEHGLVEKLRAFETAHHLQRVGTRPEDVAVKEPVDEPSEAPAETPAPKGSVKKSGANSEGSKDEKPAA